MSLVFVTVTLPPSPALPPPRPKSTPRPTLRGGIGPNPSGRSGRRCRPRPRRRRRSARRSRARWQPDVVKQGEVVDGDRTAVARRAAGAADPDFAHRACVGRAAFGAEFLEPERFATTAAHALREDRARPVSVRRDRSRLVTLTAAPFPLAPASPPTVKLHSRSTPSSPSLTFSPKVWCQFASTLPTSSPIVDPASAAGYPGHRIHCRRCRRLRRCSARRSRAKTLHASQSRPSCPRGPCRRRCLSHPNRPRSDRASRPGHLQPLSQGRAPG